MAHSRAPVASFVLDCKTPAFGAMTATLDGTPWIPFSTRAWIPALRPAGLSLWASDCRDFLQIAVGDFKGSARMTSQRATSVPGSRAAARMVR